MIRKRFESGPFVKGLAADLSFFWHRKAVAGALLTCFLTALILTRVFYPNYWHLDEPELATTINSGLTPTGHPWIGAENPKIVITEYTDYQCFQCKKMHFFLRQLIAQHPDKIRLVHRHFPMDHEFNPIVKDPFHVGSGKMALLAIYATAKEKFWLMNDFLFKIAGDNQDINVKEIAEKVGIDYRELARALNDQNIRYRLKHDISQGLKSKINGTPAFFIDGQVYLGQIPPAIIKKALN
jgi:protein-disulfide isomerase